MPVKHTCKRPRCHVGSNQQAFRAKHMSEALNYRFLFVGTDGALSLQRRLAGFGVFVDR